MGVVHLARQASLGRLVAVKRISPDMELEPEIVQRFLEEVRILSRLAHPHIVKLFDSGLVEGRPFLVMEYVEGASLSEHLRAGQRPDLGTLLEFAHQALSGLDYLHSLSLIHRDLKPANILISRDGTARVADFGLARTPGTASLTPAGSVLGSPAYLAPEVLLGQRSSVKSDLYAMGVVLCAIVADSHPRGTGCDAREFVRLRVSMDPLPLSFMVRGLDPALGSLIDGLLRRDPARRPDSAEKVRRALEQILLEKRALTEAQPHPEATATVVPAAGPAPELSPRRRRPWGRPWRWAAAAFVAAVLLTILSVRIADRPGAAGPGSLPAPATGPEPLRPTIERHREWARSVFETASSVRVVATCRPVDGATDPVLRVEESAPGTGHELRVPSLNRWASYELTLSLADRAGAIRAAGTCPLPSPLDRLRQACRRIAPEKIEAAAIRVGATRDPPDRRAAILTGVLESSGYSDLYQAAVTRCRGWLAGSGAPAADRGDRVFMLNRLSLIRRLDRVALLERLPFRSGVDELLGPTHSASPDGLEPAFTVQCPVPPRSVLSQTGMRLRRRLGGDAATYLKTRAVVPEPGAFRRASLVVEVDDLAPVALLCAALGPSGLVLELSGPVGHTGGPLVLRHSFDPAFLVGGANTVELSLELDDPRFKSSEALALVLASDEVATRRGLRCQPRACRLELR
ncbi:MAG: serine/threonine protein kinase [Candidatus Riflebacteria bacterium]|nr:serine/threonine protein kinase [Candidatus Riflebacteria bacterium]